MQQSFDVIILIYLSRVMRSLDSRLKAMEMSLTENGRQMQ